MNKILYVCILMTAMFFAPGVTAFADDCSMGRLVEGVYPMNNEEIIMEEEDINIYPYEGRAECTFTFLNTGKEKDVLMGFPCKHVVNYDIQEPERLIISDFTARDDTGSLTVTEENAVKPHESFDSRFEQYSSWFIFKAHFKKDERKSISNTYNFFLSEYADGNLLTGYILNTGSVWKDKIGYASVTFHMPGLKPYYIEALYGEPYFRLEQDKIVWERSSFEPIEDLGVLFNRLVEPYKQKESGEYKKILDEKENTLASRQNKISNMKEDSLIGLLDCENEENGGIRLAAYEKLLKIDRFHDQRIILKVGKSWATANSIKMDMDTAPLIIDNRTFVPLRFIVGIMGGDIKWNAKTKEITIEHNIDGTNTKNIIMKIGQKSYLMNNGTRTMDTVPRIINGRTLVPVRFVSENLGYDVLWSPKDKSILLSQNVSFLGLGFELMREEFVGSPDVGRLAIGDTNDKACINMLGEAGEKSEPVVWDADGEVHQTWHYKSKGIELDMIGEAGNQSINMITLSKPCSFKTSKGIGIGSSKSEVLNAYGDYADPEWNKEPDTLVLGTVYGGIIMGFKNDKVCDIFIGASAE